MQSSGDKSSKYVNKCPIRSSTAIHIACERCMPRELRHRENDQERMRPGPICLSALRRNINKSPPPFDSCPGQHLCFCFAPSLCKFVNLQRVTIYSLLLHELSQTSTYSTVLTIKRNTRTPGRGMSIKLEVTSGSL